MDFAAPDERSQSRCVRRSIASAAGRTQWAGHAFARERSFPMTARLWLSTLFLSASLLGLRAAAAQAIGPDEAVAPSGSLAQHIVLSPQQRRAIYEAVGRQRLHSAGPAVAAVVGALVPPSLALHDLPVQASSPGQAADDFGVPVLKYAMVADDVVVVDPIAMRVVDVIHRDGVKP
jgi:hypothetical protein